MLLKDDVNVSIGREQYAATISTGKHQLIADEPEDHGGKDKGLSPYQLLLSSLGACTSITLRMYADRKQWPLEGVHVSLNMDRLKEGDMDKTIIKRVIRLSGNLLPEQRERLLSVANSCPVHKVLSSQIGRAH